MQFNYPSMTEDWKVTSCLLSLSTRVVSANANPGGYTPPTPGNLKKENSFHKE